jgi:4,5-dihydroxyphthalate decarboxylase
VTRIGLTLAISEYAHVRDILLGRIVPDGIDLMPSHPPLAEMFRRFSAEEAWDVSEMSMGMYAALRANGDDRFTAIPVFPSRMFRQSSIYVVRGGTIRTPQGLAGKRIGIPSWFQTAIIYVRGWLVDDVGLDLRDIRWVQAGVDEPTKKPPATVALPDGLELEQVAERSLAEMLSAGDIDALIATHAPAAPQGDEAGFAKLIEENQPVEEAYFRASGVFPIMHLIALRRTVVEDHPWVPESLYAAFEASKRSCLARLVDVNQSLLPVPWLPEYVARQQELLFDGNDYWPYGVDPNLATLEVFLRYCFEQGVCRRPLRPADLFPDPFSSM